MLQSEKGTLENNFSTLKTSELTLFQILIASPEKTLDKGKLSQQTIKAIELLIPPHLS